MVMVIRTSACGFNLNYSRNRSHSQSCIYLYIDILQVLAPAALNVVKRESDIHHYGTGKATKRPSADFADIAWL